MTNQERAAEVLLKHWSVAQETGQDDECDCCAQALADAGLLMPDLPEPLNGYENVFKVASPLLDCRSVQAVGGQVAIRGYKSRHAPIEEARRFAYALLAAAKLAEEQE